jgi:hypothetical protein
VDTALAPAMLDLFASSEDTSHGRTLNPVVPGLWSIDVDDYHDLRAAVKVRNLASAPLASTPFAPARLVMAWDGERDKSLRCESPGDSRFEPGLEVTLWCRSMADLGWKTDSKPIDWIRSGRSNDEHRLELVAEVSSLAIPTLDLAVRRDGNDYRTPEIDHLAELARHRAGERSCFERGTCTREMFDNTGHWRATFVWALAALAVCVTAASLGRSFAMAVLLALSSTFNAGARALARSSRPLATCNRSRRGARCCGWRPASASLRLRGHYAHRFPTGVRCARGRARRSSTTALRRAPRSSRRSARCCSACT